MKACRKKKSGNELVSTVGQDAMQKFADSNKPRSRQQKQEKKYKQDV